jgi:hypothetical protein
MLNELDEVVNGWLSDKPADPSIIPPGWKVKEVTITDKNGDLYWPKIIEKFYETIKSKT